MHTRGNFGKFVKIAYVLYVYFYIVSLFSGYFRNFLLHESCKKLPLRFYSLSVRIEILRGCPKVRAGFRHSYTTDSCRYVPKKKKWSGIGFYIYFWPGAAEDLLSETACSFCRNLIIPSCALMLHRESILEANLPSLPASGFIYLFSILGFFDTFLSKSWKMRDGGYVWDLILILLFGGVLKYLINPSKKGWKGANLAYLLHITENSSFFTRFLSF